MNMFCEFFYSLMDYIHMRDMYMSRKYLFVNDIKTN